jgi:NTP pyrophosphatase (non-canonical NTP hydrolase)
MSDTELAMTTQAAVALNSLSSLFNEFYKHQAIKGFHDEPLNLDQKLLLLIGEVIEAHEEYRSNPDLTYTYYRETDGKPEGFLFEMADVFIRFGDLLGAIGIDLAPYIAEKHGFNQTRPHKHGRQF